MKGRIEYSQFIKPSLIRAVPTNVNVGDVSIQLGVGSTNPLPVNSDRPTIRVPTAIGGTRNTGV